MSAMPATSGHSAACCNLPPIVTKGYQAKGKYEEVGGYRSCMYHCDGVPPRQNGVPKSRLLV